MLKRRVKRKGNSEGDEEMYATELWEKLKMEKKNDDDVVDDVGGLHDVESYDLFRDVWL
jgi:hypothetical protein